MRSIAEVVLSFFRELRRRRVFRVALVYAPFAWITIEIAATVFPALGIPQAGVTLVIALVALGFPIALVLAWAFDLTPEGVRWTGPTASPAPAGLAGAAAPPAASAAPPAAASEPAAAGATGRTAAGTSAADRPSLRSIAALPLADRSAGGGHQFLGDGITEELISALARVEGLRVVSRTSAFAFRGENRDAREIGGRLGAGSIIEGSVRVAGDRLRLTVQLVSVEDGYALWSETYDRRIGDLLAVQEEIARAIVGALRQRLAVEPDPSPAGTLPSSGTAPLLTSSTADIEAYTLYLRGRQHWNERTPEALRRAIGEFGRAIARDARYAHAYAGLADCHAILLDYGVVPPAEGLPPARAAARRALELGPALAEAHTSAALVRQMEWRWADAEREFRRAIELDPGYVIARQRYALLLAWLARFEESRLELDHARRLDPLSPVVAASACWLAYYERRTGDAVRAGREAAAEHPDFGPVRIPLGLALLAAGEAEAAVAELEHALAAGGGASSVQSLLACALARAGRTADARQVHARLLERAAREYVSPYDRALPLLGLGDLDGALAELERAAEERSPQLVYAAVEPLLAPLREREGLRAILAAARLPA